MPKNHPRPWRRHSVFGDGPRRALNREQKARFRFLLTAHRRARRLTPHTELVGQALVRRLGQDGRLDPAHQTIADDAGCSARTVRRALDRLRGLGLIQWCRRIVRVGDAVEQVSNSYILIPSAAAVPATIDRKPSGGQVGRQIRPLCNKGLSYLPTRLNVRNAQEGLAAIAARRMRALGLG